MKLAWGRAEEQAAACAKGNRNAKNWQEEALKFIENAVSLIDVRTTLLLLTLKS
jgi:hypothetical protein